MSRPPLSQPARIPADVERDDRVLANLTARQLAILAVTGVALYGGWAATRTALPPAVFAAMAIPVALAAVGVALGSRDGVPLDRLLVAALRQRLSPRLLVAAPGGVTPPPVWLAARATTTGGGGEASAELRLPAQEVTDTGVVDLGADGMAVVAAASTVNFALRTPAEQDALVATFARFLHSLTAPVQILVRAERLDLSGQIRDLREHAGGLPHPALEAAASEHADFLAELTGQADLLRRRVLLIFHEPLHTPAGRTPLAGRRRRRRHEGDPGTGARWAAEARLARRLEEATQLLSPAGITVSGLDAGQATTVLAAACNPDHLIPPTAGLAGSGEVITTPPCADQNDEGWMP